MPLHDWADEEIAVATPGGDTAQLIERGGLLVAAVERVSPRDKDRPPACAAYRVGEPAPKGGRFLGAWRRPLTVGAPLPSLRLPPSAYLG